MPAKRAQASESTSEKIIRLRIICVSPPQPAKYGAEFGMQDNSSTAHWTLHSGRTQPNGDIHFTCECRVRPQAKTGAPGFLGLFTQGPADGRFLYLSWRPAGWLPGTPESAAPVWVRRMKIHLSSITWEQVDECVRKNGVLETVVQGTGRDGGPACASVPLEGGWRLRES